MQAVIDSLNPAIMEDRKAMRTKAYVQKNKLLYAIVFYMSVIASVLYCVLAKPMIHILYGEAYLPTVVPLRIITWYTAFSYLGVARNAWVVCENKQKYLIWLYISAAISNVILNFILIPPLGTAGAAIASLAAQIVTVVIAPCFIKPLRPNVRMMVEAITFQGVLPQDNKK